MNSSQVLAALTLYDKRLAGASVPATKMQTNRPANNRSIRLSHCRWMCQSMIFELAAEQNKVSRADKAEPNKDTVEKAMRWLGFIQCQLFNDGFYTIDQMREHNR